MSGGSSRGALSDPLAGLPAAELTCVIYSSRATGRDGAGDAVSIRRASRARNPRLDVTGFLHREEDLYFQCLEGPAEALREILTLLHEDTRHSGLRILLAAPITERRFPGWAMGFSDHGRLSLFEWIAAAADRNVKRRTTNAQDILEFLVLSASHQGQPPH